MHLHFERNVNAKCDCSILSLSWMGKVPDELPEEEGWKLNRNNYYQEGWLATGNVRGLVGVTFTTSHSRRLLELPLRTNYNLRGHRSEVILVKWNEPYQKLASCDKSGVIFVWIKYEGRWSIELINDRSTPVTHFSWSHDGRMALICYRDGFVLVGSVAGQRYWSSMLTLEARITCGCWTPDDLHVYLGTAAAQLVVMDVHGAMVSQVQLNSEGGITAMAWSCEKFKMEESEGEEGAGGGAASGGGHVLAVAFGGGELVFLQGYDDVSPVRVHTGLDGSTLAMEWANSRELLAVAGTALPIVNAPSSETCFKNMVKFYSEKGNLLYTVVVPYTQARVSALTWGHAGRRLFVACGGAVHTARVWRVVAPLQLLARVRAAQSLSAPSAAVRLPLPPRLRPLVANLFAHTIRCCVPEPASLRWFVSRPPGGAARLHCTMLRHEEDEEAGGSGGAYTLYLEHLGGLVPLLKGRRTSKIRPEFVIFDPQAEELTAMEMRGVSSSSSSSSGSSGTSSSGSSGGGAPRTPRTPRRHPHTPTTDTDSSASEQDEGCSGSPRLQRKKRAKERRRQRCASEREKLDPTDELTYMDSLPEDVRLVEVTSNIWGTKFKMHGLAANVPANLGQVTYKTSLLHLQPRQMTLVITELCDDIADLAQSDAPFNPNVFSEDEEDVPTENSSPARRQPAAPVSATAYSQLAQVEINGNAAPALARAESYEEIPFSDVNEFVETPAAPAARPQPTPVERRVSAASSVASRHAISPLRCDGSVPTLQSPKNAVAPTDIIFERPSPQAVSCGGGGGRGEFCGARADYGVSLKGNLSEQPPFSLNLSVEPRRHVTIKKSEEGCLSKLRKNMCGKSDNQATYEFNNRYLARGAFAGRTYENEVHADAVGRRGGGGPGGELRGLHRGDDLKFIDEETPLEAPASVCVGATERVKARTPTAVAISPVCAPLPLHMPRSCSVGYLDLVDPALLRAGLSVAALRRQEPRRLVLVDRKTRRRPIEHKTDGEYQESRRAENMSPARPAQLRACGKSRSLDSSELPLADNNTAHPTAIDNTVNNNCEPAARSAGVARGAKELAGGTWTPQPRRRSRRDYPICTRCRLVSPYDRRDIVDLASYVCVACSSSRIATPAPPPAPPPPETTDTDYSSLEQLALRLRAARDQAPAPKARQETGVGVAGRETASAPSSPRPERTTPAARPRRDKRNFSASPIRQLLNSPLLSRRRNKKPSESSDEEGGAAAGAAAATGSYRDLESFQKQQLRNKLKRSGLVGAVGASSGTGPVETAGPRQLVMHNKAPMWNENSQVYQLDFGGRVTQESAKNFQIEFHGKQVMQFGRIDGKAYTLDFQYPFSALQAFAVALANVTQRLK